MCFRGGVTVALGQWYENDVGARQAIRFTLEKVVLIDARRS
jgi:hypothetical protein